MRFINRFLTTIILMISAYTVNIEASLSAHPQGIKEIVSTGENMTSVLHITNTTGVLTYQLGADVDWINLSSNFGDISAGDTVVITVSYNVTPLNSGINRANIILGDPHHGAITIPVEVFLQSVTGIRESFADNSPVSFSLNQNYPNPFNPSTKITYSIPETQKVVIKVYNILGNEIMTLVNGEKSKGSYSLDLDMNGFASGVYFYTIKTPGFKETKKMILNR